VRATPNIFLILLVLILLALGTTACPDRRNSPPDSRRSPIKRQLSALPYVNWVPVKPEDRNRRGVTRNNPERAHNGSNLYCSLPRARADLMDMFGRTIHSWTSRAGQPTAAEREWQRLWPHLDFAGWQHVRATPAGDLFVILHLHGVLKLDRNSRTQWLAAVGAHHDLDLADNGEIYTLAADRIRLRHRGQTLTILDDLVLVLGPDGVPRRRLSLVRALQGDPRTAPLLRKKLDAAAPHFANHFASQALLAHLLVKNKDNLKRTGEAFKQILDGHFTGSKRIERMLMTSMLPMDPIHANGLQILPRDVSQLGRRGDLLISIRELDLLLVLDPRQGKIRWTLGPDITQRQHQPSLLDNNHLLVFDNGTFAGRSRVLELDPVTSKIVWSYQAPGFFSPIRGGCQRLPNGNTLIVESERGRAFEVTPDKTLVWEFFNPDLKDPYMGRQRAPIYRMTRLPVGFLVPPRGLAP